MVKEFAKYMTWGKIVESLHTGTTFKLIEDMDKKKDTVRAVSMENWKRYDLLKAWIRNYDQAVWGFRDKYSQKDADGWKAEKQSYEVELKIDCIKPCNKIRFITPDYKTKFEVENLSLISVNGKAARVAYLDETHFTFVDTVSMNLYGGCFHICQFAELCERDGIEVKPLPKPNL